MLKRKSRDIEQLVYTHYIRLYNVGNVGVAIRQPSTTANAGYATVPNKTAIDVLDRAVRIELFYCSSIEYSSTRLIPEVTVNYIGWCKTDRQMVPSHNNGL